MSTDGYEMSTSDNFQKQSCENNTMEEPSVAEELTILKYAFKASTTTTDFVNDNATNSTTSGAIFCSRDEIIRITNDHVNHRNTPINDANKFLVVIFVNLVADQ